MTQLRKMLMAVSLSSLCLMTMALPAAAATRPSQGETIATGTAIPSRAATDNITAPDDDTYAAREAKAKQLESFEGGGTAIYLSSGAAAVVIVILVLLIVF
ncbi:MAG: hypothetical protein ABUL77_02740 [Bacteroidota bacterium]